MKNNLLKTVLQNMPDDCDIFIEQTKDYKAKIIFEDNDGNKVSFDEIDFEPKPNIE